MMAVLLALSAEGFGADDLTPQQRRDLQREARDLDARAAELYGQGQLAEATPLVERSVQLYRTLSRAERFPDGPPDLALSLNHLGVLLHDRGDYAAAEAPLREALAMDRKLFPPARYPEGHPW